MPVIREYTQQTNSPDATAASGRRATESDFQGNGEALLRLANTGAQIYRQQKELKKDQELADLSVKMAQSTQTYTERYEQLKQEAVPGDMNFASNLKNEMNAYFNEMSNNYSSPEAKKYVGVHGTNLTTRFFSEALNYQQHQAAAKSISDHNVRIDTDSQTLTKNPEMFEFMKGSLEYDIDNGVGSYKYMQNNPRKEEFKQNAIEKMAWAATSVAAENPITRSTILTELKGKGAIVPPKANSVSAIDWILQKEGSAYVASDGHSKSEARYGINKKWNPDVDVKNLTKDQAASLYKTRYWDAIGGDSLSGDVAIAAMNVAVMSGTTLAKKYIKEANGDAQTIISMHKSFLQKLAVDPKRNDAKYLDGWMSRLEDLRTQVEQIKTTSDVNGDVASGKELPGYFNSLSPEARKQAVGIMQANQNRDDLAARKILEQRVKEDESYIQLNGQRPENILGREAFAGDEAAWQSYEGMIKAADTIQTAGKLPLTQGVQLIERLKPEEGDPAYTAKAVQYTHATKLFQKHWENVQKDPIGEAINSRFSIGQTPIKPIDFTDPNTIASQVKARVPLAKAALDSWGIKKSQTPILSNDEATAMGKMFENNSVDRQEEFIRSMSQAFQENPKEATNFFNQILPGKAGVHAVGQLSMLPATTLENGESRDMTMNNILQGMKLMKEGDSKVKGMPSSNDALTVLSKMPKFENGVSFEFQKSINGQLDAVMAHYIGKQVQKGKFNLDLNGTGEQVPGNVKAFQESVKTVIGNPVSFGTSKVLKPYGVPENVFIDTIKQKVDEAAGRHMTGYGIMQEANQPGNVYRVTQGGIATGLVINIDEFKDVSKMTNLPSNYSSGTIGGQPFKRNK